MIARREAGDHAGAVQRIGGGRALVGRHVVGVRPDGILGIVRKLRRAEVVAEPPAAERIAGPRDVHAEVVPLARQLAHQPAAGERVEEHDAVTEAGGAATAARPEGAQHGGPGSDRARGLVDHDERAAARRVHELDVVAPADVADRVGWVRPGESLTLEVEIRGREEARGHDLQPAGRLRVEQGVAPPLSRVCRSGGVRGVGLAAERPAEGRVARTPDADGRKRPHVPREDVRGDRWTGGGPVAQRRGRRAEKSGEGEDRRHDVP